MEKIKFIITMLLLIALSKNNCKGLPLRSHFAKVIAAADEELTKVRLEEAEQDIGKFPILLTTLPPIEEVPDASYPAEPPVPPDPPDSLDPSDPRDGSEPPDQPEPPGDEMPLGKDNDKKPRESSSHDKTEEDSFQENPRLESAEEKLNEKGTSGSPGLNTAVHPTNIPPLDIKWHVAHTRTKRDDDRRYKVRRKKKPQDQEESNNESLTIASGFIAGLIALLGTIMSVFILCTKCCKPTQGHHHEDDAERGSAAPSRRETKRKNKSQFKRKESSQKKKPTTENNFGANSQDTVAGALEKDKNNTSEEPPKNDQTLNGTLPTTLSFVDETSPSNAFIPCTSPMSEPANSVTPDNETPASTPRNNISDISLLSESNGSLKCFQDEHNCKSTSRSTTSAHKSADNEIIVDETASFSHSSIPKALVANTGKIKAPPTITAESSSLLKNSGHSVASANGTNISNSSTESCKTPVAPLNEVVITIDDDVETKLVLVRSSECTSSELLSSNETDSASKVALKTDENNLELDNADKSLLGSENESSSAEIIYSNEPQSEEMETITNVVDEVKIPILSSPDAPPLPPPQPTPPAASTELKRGKAIGGQRAKETRLTIRRLTSRDNSRGFLGDLIEAVSRILTGKEHSADKNKEKRKVIMVQTTETSKSLSESISLAKGVIMDEQLNITKEKRSAVRRLVIRKALTSNSTLMPHSSLSNEIAFAKSVILPENDHKKAMRCNKEKCKVIRKRVGEMQCSSFDEKIQIAASTINPDEQTRDLNAKGKYKRRVIKMDAKMMGLRGRKSSFKLDIMFSKNVICGPPAVDHVKHPQMGCVCYYCNKHWAKTGGPPCFNRPKAISLNKGILLVDGMLYIPPVNKRADRLIFDSSRSTSGEASFASGSNP